MKDDPTIERIRHARHVISENCQHDPERLVHYYMELQKQHEGRLLPVAAPTQPPQPAKAAEDWPKR